MSATVSPRINPLRLDPQRLATLRRHMTANLQNLKGNALLKHWFTCVLRGYRTGVERGYDDVHRRKRAILRTPVEVARYEALKADTTRRVLVEKAVRRGYADLTANSITQAVLDFIAGLDLTVLIGITTAMAAQIVAALYDGVFWGKSLSQIVLDIYQAGVDMNRARVIAETELTRAYAEGQLDVIQQTSPLGPNAPVTALVEYTTAGDGNVCPQCASLQGQIFTVASARGVIPRHPRCRCTWKTASIVPKPKAA